ncbi:hypothetical protein GCM10007859_26920 [Brevundimonas denitrificans]|uniref:TNase-like domain-containing protein n=1 Tax=Brevundimonas denitrificans TaxID=1443434 RepID=A0ABQ6BL82_9CAUL|nr:hypothetical protein [Brevundimonas denitrificans]GLS02663.1 hypothetical protein GCM10007859_26920 [Brevundimonas denitrificans]
MILTVVAGMWGLTQAMSFAGQATIIDSTTLEVADQRVSLWGVRSPTPEDTCLADEPGRCEQNAVDELTALTENKDVRCEAFGPGVSGAVMGRCQARWTECYGHTCTDVWRDLGGELIAQGFALQAWEQSGGAFDGQERTARDARLGVWGLSRRP